MDSFTVALLQMSGCGMDRAASLAKGEVFCRRAAAAGADLALFPEMWSAGYVLPNPDDADALEAWRGAAIGEGHAYFEHFRALARELGMAIALTYLQEWPVAPRNAVSIINRSGEVILTYAKVHTCDFSVERACTPGDGFPVCELVYAGGTVRLGAMICYDREFPEAARLLMLGGAEIIVTPNACALEDHRLGQFRTRAFENMVGVAMANYAPPKANGHSVAYDCRIVTEVDGACRDTLVVEAGEAEEAYLAPFDLGALREYRRKEPWGDAFRRPALYGGLLNTEASPPFVRAQARRGLV